MQAEQEWDDQQKPNGRHDGELANQDRPRERNREDGDTQPKLLVLNVDREVFGCALADSVHATCDSVEPARPRGHSVMNHAFRRLLRLRKDEQGPALRAFAVLFFVIGAHTILETARDALFLSKMPPSRLTVMYMALAAITLVTSTQLARLSRRFGARNGLVASLVFGAWATTLIRFQSQSSWRVTALYLFTGVLAGMLVAQFWLVVGRMFTVSEGRRVFGPIAAGGVLGAAFGSSLAVGLLMVMSVDGLLLVAACGFVIAAMLLTLVPQESREPVEVVPVGQSLSVRQRATAGERAYVGRMAMFVALATATALVADYLFKSTAAEVVPKERLGAFFAQSYAVLNVLALVVQLFFASRLLSRIGVVGAVMFLPLLMVLAGSGAAAVGVGLASVLLVRGVDGSFRHSIHRVATELLYLPLPSRLRDGAHVLIETVIARVAQAASAALIFALVTVGWATPRVLVFVILALALAWFVTAALVRSPYLDLFRDALSRGTLDQVSPDVDLDMASVERVIEALSSRDPVRVIAALQLLDQKARARLVPALILFHESDVVLRAALPILARSGGSGAWVPLAERLLTHESEPVRIEALRALAVVGRKDVIEQALTDESPIMRTHAVYQLVSREEGSPMARPLVRAIVDRDAATTTVEVERSTLLTAIAEGNDPRWADVILAMFERSPLEDLPAEVVRAMANLGDVRFLPLFVRRLGVREGRARVREAMVRVGAPAVAALNEALWDPETDRHVRLHIPRTISRFKTAETAEILLRVLEESKDGHLRYKALRGLGRLASHDGVRVDRMRVLARLKHNLLEHFRMLGLSFSLRGRLLKQPVLDPDAAASLELLLDLVDSKGAQALERAFRLLQIAHPRERIDRTYQALSSPDRRVRASAVEFLDALTLRRGEAEERELLRRAIDDPTQSAIAQSTIDGVVFTSTYDEAVARLLEDTDETLALLATHHASLVGARFKDLVNRTVKRRPSIGEASARLFGSDLTPEPHGV